MASARPRNAGETRADILAAFDGATLLAAQEAFFAEMVDFFRSCGRADRAAAVAKHAALMQAAVRAAEAQVAAIRPETILGGTSGASPG